ncbi:MAG: sodium/solute symporter [Anaerohalosphaera sp.]|nr:sodium/solute symporter [Anaerohalosphaera sp.]
MVEFGALNYIILGVYLAVMVGVGVLFAGRQKSSEDFFLAGRSMPWLVVGMSMYASLVSAVTYMGVPAMSYGDNVAIIFGVMMSPVVAPILIFAFYPVYRRLNVTTSYEYILHRFGMGARFAVSSLFILARLGWLGTVIFAPALALSVATGIDVRLAIVLMGLLATVYTALGGLSAVLWTDVAQFVILVGGAVWVAVSLIVNVDGGAGGIIEAASEAGRLDVFDWRVDIGKMTAVAAMVSYFFSFMQDYGTDQVTVQRLMAVKNSKGVAKAIIFNSINDIVITALLLFIGLGLLAYYQQGGNELGEGIGGDKILPYYIITSLPVGMSGLIITAIFAAAMSSMDSGINSVATVVMNDFVKPLSSRQLSDAGTVAMSRVFTVVFGVFATIAAFFAAEIGSIVKAWSTFMSLFAGPVLGIFLLGMLFKRATFAGWVVGCAVSLPVMGYLQFGPKVEWLYWPYESELHWIYYFPVSFLTCFTVGLGASFVFRPRSDQ